MPQLPVSVLRRSLEEKISRLEGTTRIVVFGCDCGANVKSVESTDTAVMSLICAGMLPPSFVEYALRGGADGVMVVGCREGGCEYRLGDRWTAERLTRQREPRLRHNVPVGRLCLAHGSSHDSATLAKELRQFRIRLETQAAERPLPYHRRSASS
jgi:coenzyme F420-reducing hydrogenase delta subunit